MFAAILSKARMCVKTFAIVCVLFLFLIVLRIPFRILSLNVPVTVNRRQSTLTANVFTVLFRLKHDPEAPVIVWEPFTKSVDIDRNRKNFCGLAAIRARGCFWDIAINKVHVLNVFTAALVATNVPPHIAFFSLALIGLVNPAPFDMTGDRKGLAHTYRQPVFRFLTTSVALDTLWAGRD